MKHKNVITVDKNGNLYIPKMTTKHLGIFGWAGVVIAVEKAYIAMRFFKQSITPKADEFLVKLRKKSGGRQAMTGGCIKFAEAIKDDFGDSNHLDLKFNPFVPAGEESVRIIIYRPSIIAEASTQPSIDADEKVDQVEIARWIMDNGCSGVSCYGDKGRFDGVACPLEDFCHLEDFLHDRCNFADDRKRASAEEWLVRNGYSLEPETSLDTISKSSEKQLDIFDSPEKVTRSQKTRPLPDGLPEWLRGPLSMGEQVQVNVSGSGRMKKTEWAIGAYIVHGRIFVAIVHNVETLGNLSAADLKNVIPAKISLKPVAECLAVAKEQKIGLSPLQISAIINGGVPPEGHDLPDEMFE